MLLLSLLLAGTGSATGPDSIAHLRELGCASCHQELAGVGRAPAPDLALAARRLTRRGLLEHLEDPSGTAMPDLLGGLGPGERALAVEELVAFVGSLGSGVELVEADGRGEPGRGERLYHEVGCVPCHGSLRPGAEASGLRRSLASAGARSTPEGLVDLLLRPLEHRPSGRMPDLHLSRGEAADLSSYLVGLSERGAEDARPAPAPELVARGAQRFRALGCAACHEGVTEAPPAPATDARANPEGGCLSEVVPPGLPDYRLGSEERARLRSAVAHSGGAWTAGDRLAIELTSLGCVACHERSGVGGPGAELDAWFLTDEPELGDTARVPPDLDGVGARLRRPWLERMVAEGGGVRTALRTRMPRFGEAATAGLAELLVEADLGGAGEELDDPLEALPRGEEARELRDGGRALLGTGGLACITCHRWNGEEALAFQGPDLVGSYDRLRPAWFRSFLLDPGAYRPGIVMPASWPDGVAVHQEILGGDTERQLDALWYTLSLGTSAPRPEGLDRPEWRLDVEEEPVVYRGRSGVAGFRGIAVGSPEGLHLAFDAETGALAGLWQGDFVRLAWSGQGAGDFSPRGRFHALSRDLALLDAGQLGAEPWPLRPRTSEEVPVDPDPTYPWRHGYRFLGYHLDEAGAPTLRYRVAGEVEVEDSPRVLAGERGPVLERRLVLRGAAPRGIVLRALAGEVEAREGARFVQGAVELEVPPGLAQSARLRSFERAAEEGGGEGRELLLDLTPGDGPLELVLRYRLLEGEGGR